ncbi:hypothetical protein CAOG_04884 [Capsaspora owczarzaki ATCC 30864]|uniref:hypothetical protein n=1 Tax=Capsaspora owczarzaki (strain ATCC 30864) TaxID=595528 RepID=UPI0001FE542E|nr:hypothetical protein CAOG_04884 [Capsaspora owczarzaki ATCC 30864]|eukprot:XP_004347635.1 hypothetical protein CAOG_04884 [Capsaspora owczarzaki ATCC 30864]
MPNPTDDNIATHIHSLEMEQQDETRTNLHNFEIELSRSNTPEPSAAAVAAAVVAATAAQQPAAAQHHSTGVAARRPSTVMSSPPEQIHSMAGHLILLAVDDQPHSEYAAEYCFKNVYREGDMVAFMHVYPTTASKVSTFSYLSPAEYKALEAKLKANAEAVLNKFAKMAQDRNIRYKIQSFAGDPRYIICEAASRFHVRVVLLGSRGYGALKSVLLGSVSDYVVRNCSCPVLICRQPSTDDNDPNAAIWKESKQASSIVKQSPSS